MRIGLIVLYLLGASWFTYPRRSMTENLPNVVTTALQYSEMELIKFVHGVLNCYFNSNDAMPNYNNFLPAITLRDRASS